MHVVGHRARGAGLRVIGCGYVKRDWPVYRPQHRSLKLRKCCRRSSGAVERSRQVQSASEVLVTAVLQVLRSTERGLRTCAAASEEVSCPLHCPSNPSSR